MLRSLSPCLDLMNFYICAMESTSPLSNMKMVWSSSSLASSGGSNGDTIPASFHDLSVYGVMLCFLPTVTPVSGWVQFALFEAVFCCESMVLVSCISFIFYLLIFSSISAYFKMSRAVSGSLFFTSMSIALSLSLVKLFVNVLFLWKENGLTHCFWRLLRTFDLLNLPVESRSVW